MDVIKEVKDKVLGVAESKLGSIGNFASKAKEYITNDGTNTMLDIEGFSLRKVLEYSYTFDQPTDKENQPSGIPRGGRLTVKVDAFTRKEKNNELFGWMVSKNMKKKGKIIVYMPSQPGIKLKTLQFEDAYCVQYKENYKGQADSYNTEEIQISWRKLSWDNVSYENEWV